MMGGFVASLTSDRSPALTNCHAGNDRLWVGISVALWLGSSIGMSRFRLTQRTAKRNYSAHLLLLWMCGSVACGSRSDLSDFASDRGLPDTVSPELCPPDITECNDLVGVWRIETATRKRHAYLSLRLEGTETRFFLDVVGEDGQRGCSRYGNVELTTEDDGTVSIFSDNLGGRFAGDCGNNIRFDDIRITLSAPSCGNEHFEIESRYSVADAMYNFRGQATHCSCDPLDQVDYPPSGCM